MRWCWPPYLGAVTGLFASACGASDYMRPDQRGHGRCGARQWACGEGAEAIWWGPSPRVRLRCHGGRSLADRLPPRRVLCGQHNTTGKMWTPRVARARADGVRQVCVRSRGCSGATVGRGPPGVPPSERRRTRKRGGFIRDPTARAGCEAKRSARAGARRAREARVACSLCGSISDVIRRSPWWPACASDVSANAARRLLGRLDFP